MSTTNTLKRAEIDPIRQESQQISIAPLFPPEVLGEFTERWTRVQTAFVDDPRAAVQQADELVVQAIRKLGESFTEERSRLEQQWAGGGDASTEDLRVAMQRYRSFFHRLLQL